jgi:hypothetical protein
LFVGLAGPGLPACFAFVRRATLLDVIVKVLHHDAFISSEWL